MATLVAVVAMLAATTTSAWATNYTPYGGPSVTFVGTGVTFTDVISSTSVACSTADLSGSVASPGTIRVWGANAATVTSVSISGCTNPTAGATLCSVSSTVSWGFAITGPISGGLWPAKVTGVNQVVTCGDCVFALVGDINGKFNANPTGTGAQRFTPNAGASGLVVASSPPPTLPCVNADIVAGDPFAVGGYWTNTATLPLTIT
ncbi:hypothetical protein CCO04_10550 [Pimelobacter sp. 30-1]|nr:hypothetical protein [Pimelobacter sp. 30-1]